MQGKVYILIVDDNVSLCKSLDLVLKRKGYAVTCAHRGPEAIEKVRERPFDMVFMDMKMPDMDGVEAHRRITKVRPATTVVMMTAYAADDRIHEALKEGACGVMYKPLNLQEVIALIERAGEPKQAVSISPVDNGVGA
jgi:DNA-binding NtrC family response regulator